MTLIAEVGTATTRLSLIDLVDGIWRLAAHVEGPTTYHNSPDGVARGIIDLAAELASLTGNELVRDGKLLGPGIGRNSPLRNIAITTSAAGPLPIAIIALGANQSASAAFRATHGISSVVVQSIALAEARATDEHNLVQELNLLLRSRPAVMLVAGGTDRGSSVGTHRLGGIAGLMARALQPTPHVIYAGNPHGGESLRTAAGENINVQVVENLLPTANNYRLEPARAALRKIYTAHQLPQLPGYDTLMSWPTGYIGTVAEDQRTMLRFLAERFQRNILHVDTGASHATIQIQADGHYSEAILSGYGLASSAPAILETVGYDSIAEWLPITLSAGELHQRLLNRALHASATPTDHIDLWVDLALNHVALQRLIQTVRESRPSLRYDLVIAAGALAHAARPGQATLALLDILPLEQHTGFATELYLDRFGILAACGALAHIDPQAAISIVEQDGLNNGPLATVIVPHGVGTIGSVALEVELRVAGNQPLRSVVHAGEIVRLPLPQGQRGSITIRPSKGISIGNNPAGAKVSSDEAAIGGSALGIVIDARPRPLTLPSDPETRRSVLQSWLRALDALDPDPNDMAELETPDETSELVSEHIIDPTPTAVEPDLLDRTDESETQADAPTSVPQQQHDITQPLSVTESANLPESMPVSQVEGASEAEEGVVVQAAAPNSTHEDSASSESDIPAEISDDAIAPAKRRRRFFRRGG